LWAFHVELRRVSVKLLFDFAYNYFENAEQLAQSRIITFDDMAEDLEALADDPVVQQLRDENGTDLVMLLVFQDAYRRFGRALDIRTDDDSAYSIARIERASGGFTGSHEIAHMMGCRHQRCSTCGGSPAFP